MTNLNPEAIESRLQQRLAERMESVRELITKRTALDAARAEVEEAEQADANAWQIALDAGWTVNELKQSGLTEPTAKKTRKPRVKAKAGTVGEPSTPSIHSADGHAPTHQNAGS